MEYVTLLYGPFRSAIIPSEVILYAIKMVQVKKRRFINVIGPQILAKGMTHS